ncbi:MAG: FHA domain-containing protein [Verrucomicrobia bacterium]|nr:FHA domain-containing protein [Verrucomicrobiota bacterium]
MARLTVLTGSAAGREMDLPSGVTVVGRDSDCGLVLADPSVSSHHCEIHVSDLGVHLRDLGSTNGTRIGDRTVERAEVRDGDVVTFGEVAVRFAIPPVEISIPALASSDEPAQPVLSSCALACFHHPDFPAVFQCPQCRRAYCASCVRNVHLAGGAPHWLCPHCSAVCLALTPSPPRPHGLMAALTRKGGVFDTIRIAFSRGPKKKR